MTKKELEKKVEAMENELVELRLELNFEKNNTEKSELSLEDALKALYNVTQVAFKFDNDAQEGIDIIKMLADNAYMQINRG